MRRAFAACSRGLFNFIYKASSRSGRRANQFVFLSRQAGKPSYDYVELAREFERRGWNSIMHLKKVTKRNMIPYAIHVVREVRLLAKSKVAILDRYDPVVSLLDLESDHPTNEDELPAECVHREFPRKPVVVQVWHAFGAFKKFGYQSIGTREGHSSEVLDAFNIHRNYSWVVCSGKGTKEAFAEAFSYPVERVVSLDRPEYDELVALRDKNVGDREGGQPEPLRVLMAPTLRKSASSAHPFRDLYESRNHIEKALGDSVELCWSFHPLESNLPAPGNVSSALIDADCLVTDYSSIVYEAYLLGKPTFFYVPDIRDYEVSPGLNVNPTQTSPGICFYDEQSLIDALKQLASERASCDFGKFDAFAGGAFDGVDRSTGSAASRLVDFAIGEASR